MNKSFRADVVRSPGPAGHPQGDAPTIHDFVGLPDLDIAYVGMCIAIYGAREYTSA